MARRTDGTALRYEFQIFDDDQGQGRAIADAIADAQQEGVSAAEFIRQALWFFICEGQPAKSQDRPAEPEASADTMATVLQELAALRFEMSQSIRQSPVEEGRQTRPSAPQGPSEPHYDLSTDSEPQAAVSSAVDDDRGVSTSGGLDLSPRRRPSARKIAPLPPPAEPLRDFDPKEITRQMLASIRNYSQPAETRVSRGSP